MKESNGTSAKTSATTTTTRTRLKRTTITTANGTRVETVKVVKAPELEWRLQSEAVRQLKALPQYVDLAKDVREGTFTLAADFNAGKRNATKAKASGVAAGEPDLRVYGYGARLLLIEYKNADGRLSIDRMVKGKSRTGQVSRHDLLRALGYRVEVIKTETSDECAAASVALVRGWLAANDNSAELVKKIA